MDVYAEFELQAQAIWLHGGWKGGMEEWGNGPLQSKTTAS